MYNEKTAGNKEGAATGGSVVKTGYPRRSEQEPKTRLTVRGINAM
jgi:hypothetical protein